LPKTFAITTSFRTLAHQYVVGRKQDNKNFGPLDAVADGGYPKVTDIGVWVRLRSVLYDRSRIFAASLMNKKPRANLPRSWSDEMKVPRFVPQVPVR
jgi:hypothetical protein